MVPALPAVQPQSGVDREGRADRQAAARAAPHPPGKYRRDKKQRIRRGHRRLERGKERERRVGPDTPFPFHDDGVQEKECPHLRQDGLAPDIGTGGNQDVAPDVIEVKARKDAKYRQHAAPGAQALLLGMREIRRRAGAEAEDVQQQHHQRAEPARHLQHQELARVRLRQQCNDRDDGARGADDSRVVQAP
ncbi:MAG: hypothetical protein EXR27_22980, partial [Betaproteobacteria bacterium]|nr:hypothetical protein [Betaproteobacteria bacterium]